MMMTTTIMLKKDDSDYETNDNNKNHHHINDTFLLESCNLVLEVSVLPAIQNNIMCNNAFHTKTEV